MAAALLTHSLQHRLLVAALAVARSVRQASPGAEMQGRGGKFENKWALTLDLERGGPPMNRAHEP
jgi:hypothetical protein